MKVSMQDKIDALLSVAGSIGGGMVALGSGLEIPNLNIMFHQLDPGAFLSFCLYTTVGAAIPLLVKFCWNKLFKKHE